MYRVSTPTHKLIFPFDVGTYAEEVLITYAQNGNIVLEKHKSDLQFVRQVDDCFVYKYILTQAETNKFDSDYTVEVQVRYKTTHDGASVVIPSPIYKLSVKDVLNDTEL